MKEQDKIRHFPNGGCPKCGECEILNVKNEHSGVCRKHKIAWDLGFDKFDWEFDDVLVWKNNAKFLKSCRRSKPVYFKHDLTDKQQELYEDDERGQDPEVMRKKLADIYWQLYWVIYSYSERTSISHKNVWEQMIKDSGVPYHPEQTPVIIEPVSAQKELPPDKSVPEPVQDTKLPKEVKVRKPRTKKNKDTTDILKEQIIL